MKIGTFSMEILSGQEDAQGYVHLAHGQNYIIRLRNFDSRLRSDAEIQIDGSPVGTFRVDPNGSIEIEHPTHDTGRFTFYELGTREGSAVGLKANDSLGIVAAHFYPEKPKVKEKSFSLFAQPQEARETPTDSIIPRAGGTGLSGSSAQKFHQVEGIDYDLSGQVRIALRLCASAAAPRPLSPNPKVTANVPPPPLT